MYTVFSINICSVRRALPPGKWGAARKGAAPLPSGNAFVGEPGAQPFTEDLLLGWGFQRSRAVIYRTSARDTRVCKRTKKERKKRKKNNHKCLLHEWMIAHAVIQERPGASAWKEQDEE